MILEPWKFGYMSVVVVWIGSNRPQERSLFWSAEKGTKSWWGLCTKVQNMFGINIPRFGRSRFPFSKPGGFNVAWFEISEKRSSNGVEQLQQCAMINKVLIYIRQHPQLKKASLTITFNLPHNANVAWKMQMPGQVVMSNLQWCTSVFPPNTSIL